MEEVLDRFVILMTYGIVLAVILYFYRFAHLFLYPNGEKQYTRVFHPDKNKADTLHYFGRMIGLCYILLAFEVHTLNNIIVDFIHILIWGVVSFLLYLLSLYICESILFYDFDYKTEIHKKENFSFALISFSIACSLSIILNQLIIESDSSFIILLILWLLCMVLFGVFSKLFKFYSSLNVIEDVHKQKLGAPLIFSVFIVALALIISVSLQQKHFELQSYMLRVVLKVLLSLTILPVFLKALPKLFPAKNLTDSLRNEHGETNLSQGIYESGLLITATLLTLSVVFKINFESLVNFY